MIRKSHFEQLIQTGGVWPDLARVEKMALMLLKDHPQYLPLIAINLDYITQIMAPNLDREWKAGASPILWPIRVMLFMRLFQKQGTAIYNLAHDFAHELKKVKL